MSDRVHCMNLALEYEAQYEIMENFTKEFGADSQETIKQNETVEKMDKLVSQSGCFIQICTLVYDNLLPDAGSDIDTGYVEYLIEFFYGIQ